MGIREEFYDSLRREYELEGEESFLYRYFQQRPRQRRSRSEGSAPPKADVRRDIQTFLYDVEHRRKKDQSLAMLDAYCAHRGIRSLGNEAEENWSQEYQEELETFCRSLQKGDNNSVLIPLKIDPVSGAGLYLLGSYYLEDAGLRLEKSCYYACLWIEDLMLAGEQGDNQFFWSIATKDREGIREHCCYTNLKEALSWFQFLTRLDGPAQEAYTANNGPVPPHCPAALQWYFESGQTGVDREDAIARGREAFLREE